MAKKDDIPRLFIKKGDSLKTIYAKARRAFTAADLQKYTVEEETIPAEQLLAELEAEFAAANRAAPKKARKKNALKPATERSLGTKNDKLRRSTMPTRKSEKVPTLVIKKGDSLRTIYAKARSAFTAADLQKYTENDELVPLEDVLNELEAEESPPKKKAQPKRKKK